MADTALSLTNAIPNVLTNARVYIEGSNLLGVGNVELPSLEFMTETVSGLGIAGEIEMPVSGHLKSCTVNISWNTITDDAVRLLEPKAHHLDVRCNLQNYDAGTGTIQNAPLKLVIRAMPKTVAIGKVEPGKKMESSTELEASYIKLWIGGNEVLEYSKFDFVFNVRGTDFLSSVRSNLGM